MHYEIQKTVTVNAQKAPPSKHYFGGSMSEMSSEHRASPVSFYTVITRQTTAHFSLLSPVTTPHNGQEGSTDTDYWKTTYRVVLSSAGVPACRKHCYNAREL